MGHYQHCRQCAPENDREVTVTVEPAFVLTALSLLVSKEADHKHNASPPTVFDERCLDTVQRKTTMETGR